MKKIILLPVMVISAGMMLSVAANAGSGRVRIQESTTETTTKELPSTGRGIKGLREELKSELSSEVTTKTEITSEATTESVQITTVVETSTQATTARTDMPAAVDENGEPRIVHIDNEADNAIDGDV